MAEQPTKTYMVKIRGRRGEHDATLYLTGSGIEINQRGDLLVFRGGRTRPTNVYSVGCWLSAEEIEGGGIKENA